MDCVMNVPYEPLTSCGVNVITLLLRISVPYVFLFCDATKKMFKIGNHPSVVIKLN